MEINFAKDVLNYYLCDRLKNRPLSIRNNKLTIYNLIYKRRWNQPTKLCRQPKPQAT